jgi:hypothetical protein
MSLLDDEPKHSDRTMTQTIVFVFGLILLASTLAMAKADDSISGYEILINSLVFFGWLGALAWIGNAKK